MSKKSQAHGHCPKGETFIDFEVVVALSPKQVEAARLLASGSTHQRVSRALGVCRKTISRWSQISEFQDLVNSSRSSRFQAAVESIREVDASTASRLAKKALAAVESVLDNPDSRTADRLKAASLAASWVGLDTGKLIEESEPEKLDPEARKHRIDELIKRRQLVRMQLEGMRESG